MTITLDGYAVTLERSPIDGAMVVSIDTPAAAEVNADGSPRCRVYLNNDDDLALYDGTGEQT